MHVGIVGIVGVLACWDVMLVRAGWRWCHSKAALKEGKVTLQLEMRQMEEAQQDEISRLKETMEKELATLRLDFEATMKELEQKYETRLGELRDDLELRRKVWTGLCYALGGNGRAAGEGRREAEEGGKCPFSPLA
jgi:hypothetical protein